MNDFYTYAYLREDRTPYYIGRGRKRRAYEVHRNGKRRITPPPLDRILMLKQNLSYENSVRHEIYMIHLLGRKDLGTGVLWNFTDGGDGTLNRVWTLEEREKMRQANLGKTLTPEHREKIKQTLQGKPWTEARRNAHKHTEESSKKRSESQRKRREREKLKREN